MTRRSLIVAVALLLFVLGDVACSSSKSAAVPAPASAQADEYPALPTAHASSRALNRGAEIPVVISEVLDSSMTFDTPFVTARIASDVLGTDGKLAIPAGAHAVLSVNTSGKQGSESLMGISLYSVDINGKEVRFFREQKDGASLVLKEDSSKGPSHRSVHIQRGDILTFRTARDLDL
jgi:hypothetical protein